MPTIELLQDYPLSTDLATQSELFSVKDELSSLTLSLSGYVITQLEDIGSILDEINGEVI
jgi:hypothetical protein